jgi:hypothetical protein
MNCEPRYAFFGQAIAIGAHIRRVKEDRVDIYVPLDVSVCLPVTGGTGTRSGVKQLFGVDDDVISYDNAAASANGDYIDQQLAFAQTNGQYPGLAHATRTTVSASLAGLSVFGRLAIQNLDVQMTSEDPCNGGQPTFSAAQASFQKVTVDGHELVVEIDDVFSRLPRRIDIEETWDREEGFRQAFAHHFFHLPDRQQGAQHPGANPSRYILGTIVKSLRWVNGSPAGADIQKNELTVPGLGRLCFGEIIINDRSRRITMLRLQLGSPGGGSGSCGEVASNGEGMSN